DRDLNITEINGAAQSIFATDATVVGQSLAQLDDDTAGILKHFEALVTARGESELYRYELAVGGSKKILSLTLTPLTSLSGDAEGMVMIVRDETLIQDI
ncbi:MAG: PAS domain-containing protein, partial [Desulfuromonadales bacterium]|nr:PAS domain-containing protein [Desulfuromonadales bacterium]